MSLPALVSCQAGYLWDQGWGQIGLTCDRVALDDAELLASLEPADRAKLARVPEILEFGRRELGLDPGDAYTSFLDTGGEPITHIVVASHPQALVPYQWQFPIVGAVPYKGYFDSDDAQAAGLELTEEGWEVDVRGVEAYSTLGWFSDPVLSTMLDLELPAFVELLLHETTHRTFYLPGWTEFNESLATHVAEEGLTRFIELYPRLFSQDMLERVRRKTLAERQGLEALARLRDDLDALFRSELPESAKTHRKTELYATFERTLAHLAPPETVEAEESEEVAEERSKHAEPTPPRFNNASVLLSERYFGLLPTFRDLQRRVGGHPRDLLRFLQDEWERNPEGLVAYFRSAPGAR